VNSTSPVPAEQSWRLDFLAGGGEMGERMRAFDWTTTPLGPPQHWPQSLKTAVRIMLTSRHPFWLGWGPDLTYLYNDPYKSVIGGKHPEALGQPFRVVWRELLDVAGPQADNVIHRNEGTYVEAEMLIMERHGYPEETYYTYSYSPVPNDEGGPGGLICANTDDTRRVIGERQIATIRDLATATAHSRDRLDACELSIAALASNPKDLPFALILLGGDGEQTPSCVASAGAEALRDTARWPIEPVLLSGEVSVVTLDRDGEGLPRGAWPRPPAHAALVPIMGSARNAPIGVFVAGLNRYRRFDEDYRGFLDLIAGQIGAAIAAAEAAEAERRRTDDLVQLDKAKTAFFSNVSHELRTPLTLMLGPIETLLSDPNLPDSLRTETQLAQRNALRLLKLVNSLLDFSRIEAGRTQASYEETDLAALTRDLASTFRSAMERGGLELTVDCPPSLGLVHVDREMWEKIVLNLLSNAFKFTLEGRVSVRLHREGANAVLDVTDTGIGIPAEQLPRLFDRFHRVENTRARTNEGTGIGLALVKELVNFHSGSIEVASKVGTGSTFTVRIPFGVAHLAPERVKAARELSSTSTGAGAYVEEAQRWLPGMEPDARDELSGFWPSPQQATCGGRIVLADDNADMREYVTRLLRPAGYEVIAATDGQAALAIARREPPDLILSDVMMPRLDGFELLKAVRADTRLASIHVILLSARAGEGATVEGIEAGADDYLVKPFSARELLARVAGTLALARTRRELNEKLRVSDERFRAVQDASPDGFFVLEALRDETARIIDFRWLYMNEAGARINGQPREAFIGRRLLDVHPGNRESGLFERYCQVTETGHPWIGEVQYVHDDIEASLRLAIARVGDGVAISAVDISERHRAEEALKLADRQKDEFLAMLAHELRNPLAPIRNASELLSRVIPANPQARGIVDIVRRQTTHLARLVDDLLDVSRITQKRIELRRETLELAEVIRQAIETVEPLIRERRHELQIHSSCGPLYVIGDSARLIQSLVNLLTNAAKYTDAGGRIVVRSFQSDAMAVVEVEDNGAGIPADVLPRIFDLFVQVERTLDRSQGGLGIGLSVVRRLIDMHGGKVTARSEGSGKGSTFAIRLPLAAPPPAAREPPASAPVRPKRILVVDDHVDAADTLSLMLRFDGHETHAVYSGVDVLDQVEAFRPDLILLDIGLPGMDGYEAARRIRARTPGQHLELVALTGYGQPEDRARALREGFDAHLVKPVNLDELFRVIGGRRQ
jgi:PAS domain S-box-containing protein